MNSDAFRYLTYYGVRSVQRTTGVRYGLQFAKLVSQQVSYLDKVDSNRKCIYFVHVRYLPAIIHNL